MFDINSWILDIENKIKLRFKDRVLFIGYQGSYRRGEAGVNSDIDMVVVLDFLTLEDLKIYKEIVKSMPESEKACGFICGKKEIENWSKSELFQLYNDTKSLYGDLKTLILSITKKDAEIAVKNGAEAMYHASVHSFLYDANLNEALTGLYKSIFFILQADFFVKTGEYVLSKKELLSKLDGKEKELLKMSIEKESIKEFSSEKAENLCKLLMEFCSSKI